MRIENIKLDNLYDKMMDVLENMYQEYYLIDKIYLEFYNLIKNEIIMIVKTHEYNLNINFFKKYLEMKLKEIAREKLKDSEVAFQLANNFINQNIDKITSIKDKKSFLYNFISFLDFFNYRPTKEFVLMLLAKNEKFNDVLKSFVDDLLRRNVFNTIYDKKELLIFFVETYCSIYDLEKNNLSDSMKLYLKEIREIPLLSFNEQKELIKRIKKGDNQAKKKFIEANLRLVINVAKNYVNLGLDILDLIQEGNIGLMKAVFKFNPREGYSFSSYATWWISQTIKNSVLNKGRNIHLPINVQEKINEIKNLKNNKEYQLGREITYEELSREIKLPLNEVELLMKLQIDAYTFSDLENENEDDALEKLIKVAENTVEDIVFKKIESIEIVNILKSCKLTERQSEILTMRFGLDGNEPKTLSEIGKKYNCSRENIRQIESQAIRKIRKSKNIIKLAMYMDYPKKSLKALGYNEINGEFELPILIKK